MIKLEKLTKTFKSNGKETIAVDQINLRVPEGKVCVLLGPSGCGKTTTLKMINRLVSPTSGTVTINGQNTATYNTINLRRNIGYVIQQIGLFPNMTVEENISIVPKMLDWPKNKIQDRVVSLLEMMTLDASYLKRYPNELSGGQQQRIGVARALAADPPVLLMDEPFGAIDPINRQSIQEEFIKMQEKLGKTVMFVSHDIDEAIKLADRIALFKDGRIEQYDTPNNLLANPATEFVKDFLGADRTLKRLSLVHAESIIDKSTPTIQLDMTAKQIKNILIKSKFKTPVVLNKEKKAVGFLNGTQLPKHGPITNWQPLPAVVKNTDDLRTALSRMLNHETSWLACINEEGFFEGYVHMQALAEHLGKN